MEFTVIVTSNNVNGTKKTVNSLINQNLNFKENINVILIDATDKKEIKSIYERWASEYSNFTYIANDENDLIQVKNRLINNIDGKYVNFLNSGDLLSKNTLKDILKYYNENDNVDVVCIPTNFTDNPEKNHWSNKRFENTKTIDLIKNPDYYQLFGSSCFIKRNCLGNLKFKDSTRQDCIFINEILINNPKLGLCKTGRCDIPINLRNNLELETSQSTKEYYFNLCENYFENLIKKSIDKFGEVPEFIQYCITYDAAIMLHAKNTNQILSDSEVEAFKTSMRHTLSHIPDDIILNNNIMDDYLKINCFLLKYGEITDSILEKFDLNTVFIDIYDIINDELKVLANLPNVFDRDVDVFVNGKQIETNKITFPQRNRTYFNYRYLKDYSFEFTLPLSIENKYEIEFKSNNNNLKIDFSRPCNFSRVAGYAKTKDYLSILKGNKISIEHKTTLNWIKQEFKTLVKMVRERKQGYKTGIPIRIAYMLGYPYFRNKHIWFFMDRPEMSDDNGMHLFKYAIDKDKNIKKYFVINKDSPDFKEMKKIGPVLGFKSIKHRYLGLFVENIVNSHPDNQIIYPFWGSYPHFAGLLKSNNVFLQHGITLHDVSSWLNKTNMNLSFFLTGSPYEYDSLFKYPYNYEKDTIKLLGFPRFDNLENETKKQILIMPTWRRDLEKKSNEHIIQTEYFKTFNSLINNEKLIESAKENGYEIIFRPHPNVYNFIEEFDKNDYVKIDYERVKYQALFNQGSILITDYSSVAFDFAYLKKPLIYYHYGEDFHFNLEESYFDYETMGFGEICKNEEELVNLIIDNMKNNCEIKDEYSKRVDEFFAFTDKNNCKRVYDEIKKIPLKD